MTRPRGTYICLEGGDGGGKTTLARMICQRFATKGVNALRYCFPSDNAVGSLIRQGLMGNVRLDPKAYLYLFAADGMQANTELKRCLEMGHHVVCDRHPTLSGRVFQVDHHEIAQVERIYDTAGEDGIMMPDALFVIDIPAEVSLQRMQKRDKYKDVVFESDKLEQIEVLRQRYLKLAARYSATILDGTRNLDHLVEDVIATLSLAPL